jgi:hypothetical protein
MQKKDAMLPAYKEKCCKNPVAAAPAGCTALEKIV